MRKSKVGMMLICLGCLSSAMTMPCGAEQQQTEEKEKTEDEKDWNPSKHSLEDRVKYMEDIFLGHKRHPVRNVYNLQFAGGITGVYQGSNTIPRLRENADDWGTSHGNHEAATGSMDLIIQFPVTDTSLAAVYLWAGAGGGLQPVIESGLNNGLARKLGITKNELEQRQADGLVPTLKLFHGTNDDATRFDDSDDPNNPEIALREAWYESNYFDQKLTFTVGKVDLTNYLETNAVANDKNLQFLSSGFSNNIAVDFPDKNGPGFRLTANPVDILQINLGIANAKGEWDDIMDHGFEMLEVNVMPKFGELQGNYRIYGWLSDKDHVNFRKAEDNPNNSDNENKKLGRGCGISADQQLPGNITLFGRIGWNDKDIYPVDMAWSAGGQITGEIWGRSKDVVGVAYGQAHLNQAHPDWEAIKDSGLKTGDERQVEAYYLVSLNDSVSVSPHLIYIKNPGGISDTHDVWVYGLKAHVHF